MVIYQCREIGESGWGDCSFEWYEQCSTNPHMDTRVKPKTKDETSNELLELAAKACGIEFEWKDCQLMTGPADMYGVREILKEPMPFLGSGMFWNPLIDDGDALRLAVQLNLEISRSKLSDRAYVGMVGQAPWVEYVSDKQNLYDCTRRAIVRCAAEIGRSMP